MLARRSARWESVTTIVTLLWFGLSLGLLTNTSLSLRYLTPLVGLPFLGAVFLAAGVATIFGTVWSWNLRRWALSAAAGAAATLALGLLVAVVVDLLERGATPLGTAPAVYGFFAVQLVLQAGEPRPR